MARRPSARHARPTGRGALKVAYADLVRELGAERSARHGDQLELIRLAALANGLSTQLSSLSAELADARRELRAARSAPPVAPVAPGLDPYVVLLATQVDDLRALVLAQQQSLSWLTARLVDRLDRASSTPLGGQDDARAGADWPGPVAVEVAVPAAAVLRPTEGWLGGEPPVPVVPAAAVPTGRPAATTPRFVESPAAPPPVVDAEDETVLRLRSVRSSSGR